MSQHGETAQDGAQPGATEKPTLFSNRDQAEFLARISHEIRTPLNAIMGYAEMLGKTKLDARQELFAGNIVKSSLSLVELLDTWMARGKTPEQDHGQTSATQDGAAGLGQGGALFKLLVIEDSSMIRDLFVDIFSEEAAATVFAASSGARGLELAQSEKPQLIFIDLHLPDTDGWQVAQTLRSDPRTASIPLVVMTGQLLQPEEYSTHFNDCLQKPFQLRQLRSLVDAWKNQTQDCADPTAATPPPAATEAGADLPAGQEMDDDWQERLRPRWNAELAALLQEADSTGSLQAAAELGRCMQRAGADQGCAFMQEAGERLLRHATGPDIAAVEDILAHLARLGMPS